MKKAFMWLYRKMSSTMGGTLAFAWLTFIAGLVGASETGWLGKVIFLGVIFFGGSVLLFIGKTNKW